jgi:acetyl esterase/lipase
MTVSGRAVRLLAAASLTLVAGVTVQRSAADAVVSCPTLNGTTLTASSTVTPPDGGSQFVVCTGKVRTFDGTPLHVDVSLPTTSYVKPGTNTTGTPPLVMFLSGWSNDVCQFESTSQAGTAVSGCSDYIGNAGYHWNNAWFASRGYVTLNYTPRGWYDSCGQVPSLSKSYLADMTCHDTMGEQSWVHLYDRRFEIRDAQFLASLIAGAGLADPNNIITTGDSGGGGPSWDLALSQDQVVQLSSTPSSVTTSAWLTIPGGAAMHLAAAIPMYTWTDLVDALTPNGRSSDGYDSAPPDGDHHSPPGVDKFTYVEGLYALGEKDAQYAVSCPAVGCDATADLRSWHTAINAGEPYSINPLVPTIIDQVGGQLRSPFAIPIPGRGEQKPIFFIQGLTDPLFQAQQAETMMNRLKNAYANYPVWGFFGDLGHSYAQNPLDVWQAAHNESNAWLDEVLGGSTITQSPVTVATTRCVSGQSLQLYTGTNIGAIPTSDLLFTSSATQTTTSSNIVTPEGKNADPITNSGCRSMSASQSDPNQASYTFSVPSSATLVGGPVVNAALTINGSNAELAARLWDVDASGNQTLITRSVYRFDEGTSPTTNLADWSMQLWSNAWQLQCGHSLKLELTQDDAPTFRPDNLPSSISISNVRLSLPVVSGAGCVPSNAAPEAPILPLLPAVGVPLAAVAIVWRRRRSASAQRSA